MRLGFSRVPPARCPRGGVRRPSHVRSLIHFHSIIHLRRPITICRPINVRGMNIGGLTKMNWAMEMGWVIAEMDWAAELEYHPVYSSMLYSRTTPLPIAAVELDRSHADWYDRVSLMPLLPRENSCY